MGGACCIGGCSLVHLWCDGVHHDVHMFGHLAARRGRYFAYAAREGPHAEVCVLHVRRS